MTSEDPRRADSNPPGPGLGEIERIAAGHHHDPHSVLGTHPGPDGVVIRALRPLADSVAVVLDDGRRLPMEHVHQGVFAVSVPDEKVPGYRIAATYAGSAAEDVRDDPYRHLPTLGEFDLYLIGEGRHEELWRVLGAHVREFGTTSAGPRSPSGRRTRTASGSPATSTTGTAARTRCARSAGPAYGSCSSRAIGEGARYKYAICGPDGVWREKADPMAAAAEHAARHRVGGVHLAVQLGRPGVDRRRAPSASRCASR